MIGTRLGIWPPLRPDALFAPQDRPPLQGAVLFSRARHGLRVGSLALGLSPGDEILMPTYHHGTEVETLSRIGVVCRFYDVGDELAPPWDELDRLVTPRTAALYLIHFLGFPQDVRRARRWCDERGLRLFEDAAQAWLATDDRGGAEPIADLWVSCLYKMVAVPDGAALRIMSVSDRPPRGGIGVRGLVSAHARWFRERVPGAGAAMLRRITPHADLADEFGAGGVRGPLRATEHVLPRLRLADVAARRRDNYRALLAGLTDLTPPPFETVPEGASPFVFPIAVDRKHDILATLSESGIDGLDLWHVAHPSLPDADDRAVAWRRERTIGLPVHHELRPSDIDRVISRVRGATRRGSRSRDTLADLRDPWDALASGSRNVFATWEFAAEWLRHIGTHRRYGIPVSRGGGEIDALLPVSYSTRGPLRVARFVGHGPADELGDLVRPGRGQALAHLVRDLRDADVLIAEHVAQDAEWPRFVPTDRVRVLGQEPNPVLSLGATSWDEYLAGKSRNLRQTLRRRERQLARDHDVRFRLRTGADGLDDDLATLFDLHMERWGRSASAFVRHESFHRAFARVAALRGWLRLWVMEIDGVPAAAWYGFRYRGVDSFYQSGRSSRWDEASLGLLMHARAIRSAIDDGIHEYRFLRGGESYKARFANGDRPLMTLIVGRTSLGRAAAAVGGAVVRSPSLRRIGARAFDTGGQP